MIRLARGAWPHGLWIDTARGDECHIGRTQGAGSRFDAWICTASGREWSWRRNGARLRWRLRHLVISPAVFDRWVRRYP